MGNQQRPTGRTAATPDGSAVIGILMLETQFPRILGDIGHPDSWSFPVRYSIVNNATAAQAIKHDAAELVPAFIHAAKSLVDEGVSALTTSCGFLSLAQQELSAAVNVPVACSALMQVPWVNAMLPPGLQTGVLTIDKSSLSTTHLAAAGVPINTPIGGVDSKGLFATTILQDSPTWDPEVCRQENVAAAIQLRKDHPDIGAIVLECTNMVPYAPSIHRATGLPVYSIHTLVRWLHSGLSPQSF